MPDSRSLSDRSERRDTRRDAVLYALAALTLGGLYVAGYIMGARAETPNSPWAMAGFLVVGVFVALLIGLWRAAAPESKPLYEREPHFHVPSAEAPFPFGGGESRLASDEIRDGGS